MHLDNVELFSQVTMEHPTKHQATMKFINSPNPNNTMNISQMNQVENELTKKKHNLFTCPMPINLGFFLFVFSFSFSSTLLFFPLFF